MSRPFRRVDVVVTMHTDHGAFTLTVENSGGPERPQDLGTYIADAVQRQYDDVRTVPPPPPVEPADVTGLRDQVYALTTELTETRAKLEAGKPRRGRPPGSRNRGIA